MPIIKAVAFFTFRNYNIVTFRCPRSYACGRSNFIFLYSYINRHGFSLVYITYRYVLICLMFIPPPKLLQKYRQVSDWVDAEQMM